MEDGSPYKSKHRFTCQARVEGFKKLLDEMAAYPQDYVSERGRLTTNTVEGFHGLALVYRDKRTDHVHYTCKTNKVDLCKKKCISISCTCNKQTLLEPWPCVEALLSG